MKLKPCLILAAGALALAGCSSTPTKVDSGPIHARTFSFVNRSTPPPEYADLRQAVHTMIQQSITKDFAKRGVIKVSAGGDITVGYLLIIGNNASTASINDYFGYSEDASALQEKAHEAYTSSKNPNYFEAGTLVIDIIDSRTFKLLKRSYATRQILKNLPDNVRAARLQEVVDQILQDVQIAP
jgi:hypothetical protein